MLSFIILKLKKKSVEQLWCNIFNDKITVNIMEKYIVFAAGDEVKVR